MRRLKEALDKGYSNLNLAFYKLHAIKDGFFSENGLSEKRKFLKELKSSLDSESLCEGVILLKSSIETAAMNYTVKKVYAKVGYRFVTGMGYPSPVENGMLLHHIYGVPYIHGESVKGLVRYVYLSEKFPDMLEEPKKFKNLIEELEEGEYKKDENLQKEYSLIFGDKKHEGSVVFFDAYPVELTKDNLVIDIMNPHYREYYRSKGEKEAVDWDRPNPIFFLTLEGVKFCFTVGFNPLKLNEEEGKEKLEKVASCLKGGLELFGLGGKKRKGYGWFEIVERQE